MAKGSISPSPSPSAKLLCSIHNRPRTRRNLIRIDGGLWRCRSVEPCIIGKRKTFAKERPHSQRRLDGHAATSRPSLSPLRRLDGHADSLSPLRKLDGHAATSRSSLSPLRIRQRSGRSPTRQSSRSRTPRMRHRGPDRPRCDRRRSPVPQHLRDRKRDQVSREDRHGSSSGTYAMGNSHGTSPPSPVPKIAAAEAALTTSHGRKLGDNGPQADVARNRSPHHSPRRHAKQELAEDAMVGGSGHNDSMGSDPTHNEMSSVRIERQKSPSPSQKLLCTLHGRLRTRRNLRRIGNTDRWCCNPAEPCLLPGQAPLKRGGLPPGFPLQRSSPSDPPSMCQPRHRSRTRSLRSGSREACVERASPRYSPARRSASFSSSRSSSPQWRTKRSHNYWWRHDTRRRSNRIGDRWHPPPPATNTQHSPLDEVQLESNHDSPQLQPGSPTSPNGKQVKKEAHEQMEGEALQEAQGTAPRELVLCTLHRKWRLPDLMARKANGDWVCTGEDKCKVGEDFAPLTQGALISMRERLHPVRFHGQLAIGARHTLAGSQTFASRLQAAKQRAALAAPMRPRASSHQRSGLDKNRLRAESPLNLTSSPKRDSLTPEAADGNQPPSPAAPGDEATRAIPVGTMLCQLHNKPRFLERLERRGNCWVCKPNDRCRNVDEVRCLVHKRWRTTSNMVAKDNGWVCKPDCGCR